MKTIKPSSQLKQDNPALKPLKFTPEMLEAIREGRKTQTRRPVEPQPITGCLLATWGPCVWKIDDGVPLANFELIVDYCPYGQPGTRHTLTDGTVIEITAVRVERVQDISYDDMQAEGVHRTYCADPFGAEDGLQEDFIDLWESIYPGSWVRNDWVWVIEFKRLEARA